MSDETFKPMTPEDVRRLRDDLHARGRKLVFTNGCFDLLHAGHVRYLNQARALGDALVVALNSDASVRALKGPSRPVNSQNDRAEVLAALRAVDAVVVFGTPRVTRLIEQIHPHVYAKGGDYTVESLNAEERAALEATGAEIHILPLVPGRSTTATIERMLQPEEVTPPLRLAVLGSGEGSNFKAILDAIEEGALHAQVVMAISDNERSRFLKIAREACLPTRHVDGGPNPRRLSDQAQQEIARLLKEQPVDVVVLTGFMRILKAPALEAFQDRIINVHPSLLPKFKGASAPQMALDEGEVETGCTVHLVTADVDGGRILAQATVPIEIGDTAETLHSRIKRAEHKLLPRVLAEWRERGLPVAS